MTQFDSYILDGLQLATNEIATQESEIFEMRPGVPWRETDRRNDGPKQGSERRIGVLLKQFVTTSQIVMISYV